MNLYQKLTDLANNGPNRLGMNDADKLLGVFKENQRLRETETAARKLIEYCDAAVYAEDMPEHREYELMAKLRAALAAEREREG